jgi:RimJ/RimL family protein N-acetyltransferase
MTSERLIMESQINQTDRRYFTMQLKTVNSTDIDIIAHWLADKTNYQWLDFGDGIEQLEARSIKLMLQRKIHQFRIFTHDKSNDPIGLVVLSDINRSSKTAVLWYVLGDKTYGGKKYTTRAVSEILTIGFGQLGLQSIFAWTVEHNVASRKVLEYNNFQFIGKRRKCHYINGIAYDRYYFDLLKNEHVKFNRKTNIAGYLQN